MAVETLANLPGDLLRYYMQGGPVMHMISILSLFSITTIIYKMIVFFRIRTNLNEIISKVRAALLKGNVKGAMAVCEQTRGPLGAIIKTGLLKYGSARRSRTVLDFNRPRNRTPWIVNASITSPCVSPASMRMSSVWARP